MVRPASLIPVPPRFARTALLPRAGSVIVVMWRVSLVLSFGLVIAGPIANPSMLSVPPERTTALPEVLVVLGSMMLAPMLAVPPLMLSVPFAPAVPVVKVTSPIQKLLVTLSTPVELGPEPTVSVPAIDPPLVPLVATARRTLAALNVPVSKESCPPLVALVPPVPPARTPTVTVPACTFTVWPVRVIALALLAGVPAEQVPMIMSAVLAPPARR